MSSGEPALTYKAIGKTSVGMVRDHNEDSFVCDSEAGIWLVADGMGGHESGEIASEIASDEIPRLIKAGTLPSNAIQAAHEAIKSAPEKGVGVKGMGTTAVLATADRAQLTISWVGDSRAYLYSPTELIQVTKDHSFVQHLLDSGAITQEEAELHPEKNIITQCLGTESLESVTVDEIKLQLYKDEKLLLCSDGLTGEVSDAEIFEILKATDSLETAVSTLISKANENGGSDNITVILIDADESAIARPKAAKTRKMKAVGAATQHKISKAKNIAAGVLGILIALLIAYLLFTFILKPKEENTPTSVSSSQTHTLPDEINSREASSELESLLLPANLNNEHDELDLSANNIQIGQQNTPEQLPTLKNDGNSTPVLGDQITTEPLQQPKPIEKNAEDQKLKEGKKDANTPK
ncbi:Stp1/IreP family PP2C-type Ser/Thr phosphatase [Alteromonas hispanica]|uniref:Stp1/IreP family PP2C-type Ser/Thr phosphatase n=1 Tax=Alteromonas hispanica TaxID=315421 RepID=A0A6L9MSQ1_9ALTE|nr:Stp1/IreP family PP2C-type Ser/Thr phosphatase [Alteromonas hispanica]NDW21188.1 Stp1/IreP family PP2C-type Ser/Thr phosphatase [Alteromonas hispanica]